MSIFGISVSLLFLLISFAVNFVVNSFVLYIVVNYIVPGPEREPFKRCMLAIFFMLILVVIAGAVAAYMPVPLVDFLLPLLILLFGSKVVLESVFERMEGGFLMLACYLGCLFLINWLLYQMGI